MAETNEFEFELPGGQKVYTGNIVPETLPLSFQAFPDTLMRSIDDLVEIVNNKKREARRVLFGPERIMNQGRRSSCNAYMMAAMLSRMLFFATGKWIKLAPEFVYMLINGGRDSGSMLDDGMVAASDIGCAIDGLVPYQAYQKSKIGMEEWRFAEQNAAQQKFGECYQMPNDSAERCWGALLSCLAGRGVVGLAVHVGRNFMGSGKKGGVDRGPGNHAVPGDDLVLLTDRPRSVADIAIDSPGSWGTSFADGGRTLLTIEHIEQTMRNHGLYGCRSALMSPDQFSETRLKSA